MNWSFIFSKELICTDYKGSWILITRFQRYLAMYRINVETSTHLSPCETVGHFVGRAKSDRSALDNCQLTLRTGATTPSERSQQTVPMAATTNKKREERAYGRLSLLELSAERAAAWTVRAVAGDTRQFVRPASEEKVAVRAQIVSSTSDGARPNVGLRCGTCDITAFESLDEQYAHFKSDWHCRNLKRRAKGLPSLPSDATTERSGDGDSGYMSSSSSASSGELSSPDEDASEVFTTSEPVVEFSDGASLFKVYKTVLPGADTDAFDPYSALTQARESRFRWAILLLRSGRFAGAVFDKEKAVCHKTFQRYTVRRKQGGAQSASDAGGKAKSAGATLRRYNEAALKQDVAALLEEWKRELDGADLIFLSSGKTDRSTFFPDKNPVLRTSDPRLRRIPFATGRPTFEEVCRVRSDLSSVRFSPLPPPSQPSPSTKTPKSKVGSVDSAAEVAAGVAAIDIAEKEEEAPPAAPRIIEIVQGGKVKELKELLSAGDGVDVNAVDAKYMTALHHAAAKNDAGMMDLLLEHGANPGLLDLHSRPAYFVCSTKETRNVLRRYMAEHPDAWDYSASQIPDGLTSEMEQRKKEKEAEKRRRARERKKQQKKQAAEEKAQEAARQEEEERQIAAGLACDFCGKYAGKSPFTRLEFKYCSTECVNGHRRQLMSEAALRRLGN